MSGSDRAVELAAFWKRYSPVGNSKLPKHVALCDALGTAITDGFWKRGAKLPTEAELAESCPYSLGTVQRAMRGLVERGLVERRRRRGTYVPDIRRQMDNPWHCRFLADDGNSFLPVFTTVISRTTTDRQGPWSHALEQEHETVVQIDRRMEINSEFTVYSKFFVRADRFPRLLDIPTEELSGANLKTLIINAVDLPLTTIREQLRMVEFPRAVCEAIDVPRKTVGLHVQATAMAGSGLPVYYQELYIPPTERRLYMDSRLLMARW